MKNKKIKKITKTVSVTDYKSLEPYFEEMAAKGWMLSEFKKNKFVFSKIEPKELDFNVSLFYEKTVFDYPNDEADKEYIELCENSGWTLCATSLIYKIFYKEKDTMAIPIYTDAHEEYKMIKKIFMKTDFISMISLFFVIGLGFMQWNNFDYSDLLSNLSLFNKISPIILTLLYIYIFFFPISWFMKNKINIKNGEKLKFATNKSIKIRNNIMWSMIIIYFSLLVLSVINTDVKLRFLGIAIIPIVLGIFVAKYCLKKFKTKKRTRKQNIIFFSIVLVATLIVIEAILIGFLSFGLDYDYNEKIEPIGSDIKLLRLEDFKINETNKRARMHKNSSVLAPVNFEYYESLKRKIKDDEIGSVETQYIECINKNVADYIFDKYIEDDKNRKEKRIAERREYRNIEEVNEYIEKNKLNEIDKSIWNVDRGYYLASWKTEIIIQKENKIYILNGDMDFSDLEIIEICKNVFEF